VQPSDGLNLRSGPGSNFGVLVVLAGGTSVTVTGATQNNWDPVSVNGSSGWVDATYLSASASNSQAAPTITANSSSSTGGASVTVSAGTPAGTTTAVTASTGTGAGVSLAWPNDSRKITTVFSPAHLGIDIDQFPNGSKFAVGAAAAGTVTFAGGDSCCSYGLYVVVDHGNGLSTLYAHFSSLSVQKGQAVTHGQKLGLTGCTGTCTGDHVHFEVHVNNTPVDPLRYLPGPWVIE
jgi:murein DD-endopeptidase MepM/ murein hydrolase activator NlpD